MKYLLIDGFNIAFRSFYGMPAFARKDGFPTGAIHGWVKTISHLLQKNLGAQAIVFFDKGGSERHLEILPEYKAQRAKMPEEMEKQMPEIKRVTTLWGVRLVEQNGIEADDLIGSVAMALAARGDEVLIVSADKDFAQIVGQNITQLLPTSGVAPWVCLDRVGVVEKFGIPPEAIVDYLSLIGDSADNIAGIAGVGPKTATAWLKKYGSLDGIFRNLDSIEPARFRKLLAESQALLARNRELIRLRCDCAVDLSTPAEMNLTAFLDFFSEMEMNTLRRKMEEKYVCKDLFDL